MTQERRPVKKRKSTYLCRKDESNALQGQVRELQRHVETQQANRKQELYEVVGLNVNSSSSTWQRRRVWWASGSGTGRATQWPSPFVLHLDALKPHFSEERFEDASGDFCCVRNEVIPFPGVQSMHDVFEALKFTMDTLEISISEHLGHLTIRDDYDTVDESAVISNYRLRSSNDSGVTTELNAVAFGQQIQSPGEFGGQQCTVVSLDSVYQDDHECVRKELNGSIVLVPVHRKSCNEETKTVGGEEDEVVIVMLRSFFVKTCHPRFDVSEVALQDLQDNVTRWGDVVVQAVRKMIYANGRVCAGG
ncbi:hypothetical protein PHYPSEUDO_007830 [Phytophthora pseudosyringae]|uniref:Uncharacterized protein n=1 Tax=Phytophthora pseudosyringae TaxID=221518 RepID=A0A8T1VKZ0_9STRA|nr:hypothetical protein PHYPSEUDO_007830 [Phytophthora pseudosyringae]